MPPTAKRERGATPSTSTSIPATATAVKKESAAGGTPTPTGATAKKEPTPAATAAPTFRDFPIFSSQLAPHTRINLLRFAHHTPQDPTDPTQFVAPLKMNRKWPPRPKPSPPRPGDPVRDAAGTHVVGLLPTLKDGDKPKKGKLYWPKYGEGGLEEIRKALHIPPELNISAFPPQPKKEDEDNSDEDSEDDASSPSKRASSSKKPAPKFGGGGGMRNGGNRGGGGGGGKKRGSDKRNIREIHKAPEDIRLLRKQEYMPWVLEDFETSEEWESGHQAAARYRALVAQFGEKHASCAGNAGLVQMYLRGAVEGAEGEDDGAKKKKKKMAGFMDRNHAPWIGKLEGDVHSTSTTTAQKPLTADNAAPSSYTSVSSSPHVIFVFDHRHDGSFKLVPVQAAYKFTQKPAYSTTTADEANDRWEALDKLRQRGGSAYQKIALAGVAGGSGAGGGGGGEEGQGEGAKALLHARNRGGPRRSTGAGGRSSFVKREKMDEDDAAELASWSTFQQRSALALPGMQPSRPRNLLAVFGDQSRGGGGGGGRRGGFDGGGGTTLDEVEYEEDFADDEEVHQGPGAENLAEEREQKEYADRLKEEMARAGWDGRLSGNEDESGGSDGDGDGGGLFGEGGNGKGKGKGKRKGRGRDGMGRSGRELKKVMKMAGRAEGFDTYDSEDEEVNPYASEEEEESESDEERHLALTNPEEAVRRAREAKREKEEREAAVARRKALAAERDGTAVVDEKAGGGVNGRGAGSQGKSQPASGSGSGFASTAQRAAAPNPLLRNSGTYIPRARPGSASPPPPSPSNRAPASPPPTQGSPASSTASGGGGGGALKVTLKRKSEAISGRATSPASGNVSPPASRAGSPSAPTSPSSAEPNSGTTSTAKRQKTSTSTTSRAGSPPVPKQPANEIEREVIRLVRDQKVQTTQELVRHFAKQVKNPESKEQLSSAIRRVCMIERGKNTLRLKDGW
ncbi:hypothetical protein CF326_g7118 [Tilletia indica]|nr:hypothetical protein CF326_g7118 [Tilletia indica]